MVGCSKRHCSKVVGDAVVGSKSLRLNCTTIYTEVESYGATLPSGSVEVEVLVARNANCARGEEALAFALAEFETAHVLGANLQAIEGVGVVVVNLAHESLVRSIGTFLELGCGCALEVVDFHEVATLSNLGSGVVEGECAQHNNLVANLNLVGAGELGVVEVFATVDGELTAGGGAIIGDVEGGVAIGGVNLFDAGDGTCGVDHIGGVLTAVDNLQCTCYAVGRSLGAVAATTGGVALCIGLRNGDVDGVEVATGDGERDAASLAIVGECAHDNHSALLCVVGVCHTVGGNTIPIGSGCDSPTASSLDGEGLATGLGGERELGQCITLSVHNLASSVGRCYGLGLATCHNKHQRCSHKQKQFLEIHNVKWF